GSGRSTAARAFAATLQCEQGSGCGRCPACRTTLAGTHPDVTVVATDKLSIAKEEVRALVMTAQRAPATGHRRVVIVEDADRMSAGTFNVLLKSIEEPPPATVWMLCAPSAEDLAPTIRSRCRLVTLSVPPSEVVAELLRRRDGIDDQLAVRAARAAQGHIGLALRYATQDGALAAREESHAPCSPCGAPGRRCSPPRAWWTVPPPRRRSTPTWSRRRRRSASCARPGSMTARCRRRCAPRCVSSRRTRSDGRRGWCATCGTGTCSTRRRCCGRC